MASLDPAVRPVVDELANALQVAVALATHLRQQSHATADDAVALEAAIRRAASALRRLQPSESRKDRQ
jgi:hypothetical protein